MMTITYQVKNGIYINLTNRCPCACRFCLRQYGPSAYGSDSLWLDYEPSILEICNSLDQWDLSQYDEVVFCGYGEPTQRLDVLVSVAQYLRSKSSIPIRLNTNGLADLIWQEKTAHQLQGLIDTVSISLNTDNPMDYLQTVRPRFGYPSYQAMLDYAKDCKKYVPNVVLTIVDVVTSKQQQENCQKICDELKVTLRIRPYQQKED